MNNLSGTAGSVFSVFNLIIKEFSPIFLVRQFHETINSCKRIIDREEHEIWINEAAAWDNLSAHNRVMLVKKEDKVEYWLKSAEYDWKTGEHLFEKRDYPYALFFGHLTIEKILKALFVNKFNEQPPLTHRLVYLAEQIGLQLTPERMEILEVITDFNLEARYPDEKFSFYKRCTREFTEINLKKIEDIKEWLLKQIP